jgi:hypothetical protein
LTGYTNSYVSAATFSNNTLNIYQTNDPVFPVTTIIDNGVPDSTLASTNVVVTSGAAIPAGTYRVLWMTPQMKIPTIKPLGASIYIKGDTKF